MNDKPKRQPVTPALAATILLLRDDPFEVLMVRRRSSSFFASALVFPGGVVEPHDYDDAWMAHVAGAEPLAVEERALRIAACREAFEETSVLLTASGAPAAAAQETFLALVQSLRQTLPVGDIVRFAHWITPEMSPKRFDTHFFVAAAPPGADARCDGDETVSLEWVRPLDAVARAEAGENTILFPTLMNLKRLAESDSVAAALAAARTRTPFTVLPKVRRQDDQIVVMIPPEAGYGVTEFILPDGVG
ncbi:MAG: NUDIX domain-containing protein [Hyphomonadaceae bacterium]